MTYARRLAARLGSIAVLAGIVTIAFGEFWGIGWTRLVSATLVGTGGLLFGVARAADMRGAGNVRQVLARHRRALAVVLALVLALPAFLALSTVLLGLALLSASDALTPMSLLGVTIAGFMLAAVGAVSVATLRATRSALADDRSGYRATQSGSPR